MSCGHECSCPSKLYHDVDAIVRRQEAPIPPMTMGNVLVQLQQALDEEKEREDERIAEVTGR